MKEKRSFRHPTANTRYTRSLFWECYQNMGTEIRVIDPIYTLYHDKPGFVNFRTEYVRLGDPTGYKLSQLYLEDYSHWELLMKCKWFKEAKVVWDRELDARLKSEGMEAIRLLSEGIEGVSPAVQLQAAKFLAKLEHKTSDEKKSSQNNRGRPSKEEVEGKLKQEAEDSKDFEDDMARIGFKLKGSK